MPARAETGDVELMNCELSRRTDGLYLSADWEFDLSTSLIECLRRGIALYFVCEVRLQKSRWYWFDKTLLEAELLQRISFSPLSRTYRFSRGGISQTYDTFEQIMPLVRHIAGWRIADNQALQDNSFTKLELRMRLDVSRLPKPLQVSLGGNSDWSLDSDWLSLDVGRLFKNN